MITLRSLLAALALSLSIAAPCLADTVELWTEEEHYTLQDQALRDVVLNVANRSDRPIRIPSSHFPEGGELLLVYGGVEWRVACRMGLAVDRDAPPLQPGDTVQWRFDAIRFGYSNIPVGSHTNAPEELELQALFEIRYIDPEVRGRVEVVRSRPFTLRCPAWWFGDLTRSMVAESVGPDSDPTLVEAEIDRLIATVEGDNGDLPAVAARKLAILAPARATGPLIAMIDRSLEVEDVRKFQGGRIKAALEALAAIGGPEAEQAVFDTLVQAQAMDFAWVAVRDVRITAMRACGELRVQQSLPVLLEVASVEGMDDLMETHLDQKSASVAAIGQLGDPSSCAFLISLCEHARNRSHHTWEKLLLRSAEALVAIGDPQGIAYLEQLAADLEDGSRYQRRGSLVREVLEAGGAD